MPGGLRDAHRPVCSAHAEVIPADPGHARARHRLLRTRGGDPDGELSGSPWLVSAPHTRR